MIDQDKRWRDREERWVAPPSVFQSKQYSVDVIRSDTVARAFIEQHHYSGSFPAARLKVGLYAQRSELVGVAVFSEPANRHVIRKYTGLEPDQGAELGRFVCLDNVAYNGETRFLARAFKALLVEKGLAGVVSYADPLERHDSLGMLVKQAHWGTIYKASNALYKGRTTGRTLVLAPDGTVISERAITKLRNEERGWAYAYRQLLAHGAPARKEHEELRGYTKRALVGFRRAKHPGNLVYTFGLTRAAQQSIRSVGSIQPYPTGVAA